MQLKSWPLRPASVALIRDPALCRLLRQRRLRDQALFPVLVLRIRSRALAPDADPALMKVIARTTVGITPATGTSLANMTTTGIRPSGRQLPLPRARTISVAETSKAASELRNVILTSRSTKLAAS
jgi:hypothetical protein